MGTRCCVSVGAGSRGGGAGGNECADADVAEEAVSDHRSFKSTSSKGVWKGMGGGGGMGKVLRERVGTAKDMRAGGGAG